MKTLHKNQEELSMWKCSKAVRHEVSAEDLLAFRAADRGGQQ